MASTASNPTQIREELLAPKAAEVATYVPVVKDSTIKVVGLPVGLPHNFLPLSPTTSAFYPVSRKIKPAVEAAKATTAEDKQADITLSIISAPQVSGQEMWNASRSSSMSSEASCASPGQRQRFLRLGPVHDGEHADENGDWSEEVIIG